MQVSVSHLLYCGSSASSHTPNHWTCLTVRGPRLFQQLLYDVLCLKRWNLKTLHSQTQTHHCMCNAQGLAQLVHCRSAAWWLSPGCEGKGKSRPAKAHMGRTCAATPQVVAISSGQCTLNLLSSTWGILDAGARRLGSRAGPTRGAACAILGGVQVGKWGVAREGFKGPGKGQVTRLIHCLETGTCTGLKIDARPSWLWCLCSACCKRTLGTALHETHLKHPPPPLSLLLAHLKKNWHLSPGPEPTTPPPLRQAPLLECAHQVGDGL